MSRPTKVSVTLSVEDFRDMALFEDLARGEDEIEAEASGVAFPYRSAYQSRDGSWNPPEGGEVEDLQVIFQGRDLLDALMPKTAEAIESDVHCQAAEDEQGARDAKADHALDEWKENRRRVSEDVS